MQLTLFNLLFTSNLLRYSITNYSNTLEHFLRSKFVVKQTSLHLIPSFGLLNRFNSFAHALEWMPMHGNEILIFCRKQDENFGLVYIERVWQGKRKHQSECIKNVCSRVREMKRERTSESEQASDGKNLSLAPKFESSIVVGYEQKFWSYITT